MQKISVIGVGKAGLPLASVIAESGLQVIGVGRNQDRINSLNKKHNPIPEETGLSDLMNKNVGNNLVFTADAVQASKDTQVHVIIVPLFIDDKKQPDFSNMEEASTNIAKGLKKGDIVVLETTVPVGTTQKIIKPILEKISGLKAGKDFHLGFSPERMMTGYAISRYKEVPKVVGGINPEATHQIAEFYRKFCSTVVEVSSIETAEMTKIGEGVYRDVNIALANELFKICENNNIDFWEMQKAAQTFACHLHEPGNVGGHCIPVYPWFLINNFDVPLIEKARHMNDDMVEYYKDKVAKIASKGKVLVVGLSFREGVKETAYTRSIPFVKTLEKNGFAVSVFDPLYNKQEVEKYGLQYSDDFDGADCIVFMDRYHDLRKKYTHLKNKTVFIKN